MKVVLIAMTILGCDDGGQKCRAIETRPETYISVAACDRASQTVLDHYQEIDFPMVVAVCQSKDAASDPLATQAETDPAQEPSTLPRLADRAISLVTEALPDMEGLATIVEKPVHIVTDSYSWVARKIGVAD